MDGKEKNPFRIKTFILLSSLIMVSGCASLYFQRLEPPPGPPPRYGLHDLTYREYWTGIVFNGKKIGFSHLAIGPSEENDDLYELRAEAVFLLRLLGMSKKVILKSYDLVREDLALVEFTYHYIIDDHELRQYGEVRGDRLEVYLRTQHDTIRRTVQVTEKVYPTSIITLYPVFHGLKVGRGYAYLVYDGQTQEVTRVTQKIEAYQRSKLFSGYAYKVISSMHGQRTTTWINQSGQPVLELAMNGVLVSCLEGEKMAKEYLLLAALNKEESLLDYSLVKTNTTIPTPRKVTFLRIALRGAGNTPAIPSDQRQTCYSSDGGVICEITAIDPYHHTIRKAHALKKEVLAPFLRPSLSVECENIRIKEKARRIVGPIEDPLTQISKLVEWIQANIAREPVDVISALDVLVERKAECQGHALLYTAFARALGIPSKMINGLVYSEQRRGFLYHSWAESYVSGTWVPVDPIFGTLVVDATHIKLVEGETAADCLPLVEMIGRLKSAILSFEYR